MTLLERELFIRRIWMTENKSFTGDDSALFIPEADRRDLKPASIKSHLQRNQKNLVVALLVRGSLGWLCLLQGFMPQRPSSNDLEVCSVAARVPVRTRMHACACAQTSG